MANTDSYIHVGDIGTVFIVTIKEGGVVKPISAATGMEFVFERPDKTSFVKDGVWTTDGTDGKVEYTTEDGTILDQAGQWDFQVVLTFPNGQWTSSKMRFHVREVIPHPPS